MHCRTSGLIFMNYYTLTAHLTMISNMKCSHFPSPTKALLFNITLTNRFIFLNKTTVILKLMLFHQIKLL